MSVGAVGAGSAALQLARSAVASNATQEQAQVAVAKKALETMEVQGQAAVSLIQSAGVGQFVNVKA